MPSSKTIAISGISRGIGKAIALAFGQVGWTVFGAARKSTDLDNLTQYWQKNAFSGQLHLLSADLGTAKGCHQWAKSIQEITGHLDALINNVGQFAPGTLIDSPEEQLSCFLQANVLSAHYLSRALLPLLKVNTSSFLITIGSVATSDWPASMANYALSKHLLEAWHRTMSKELENTSINCTLIRPGATYTSSWDGVDIDPKTLLAPKQIADLIVRRVTQHDTLKIEEITIRP